MSDSKLIEHLISVYGDQFTFSLIEQLERLKKTSSSELEEKINEVVNLINGKIPVINEKFKKLTVNITNPLDKLQVLNFIIKSIKNIEQL